ELAVNAIINLEAGYAEESLRVPPGVNYVYLPVKDEHAPTQEQAKKFLDLVANPGNWPILVHCDSGEGRTGLMCALIRHSFDGWGDERIMHEVNNFRIRRLNL